MSGSIFFDVCIHIFRKMSRRTAFKTNYDPVIQYLIEGRKFWDNRCCGKHSNNNDDWKHCCLFQMTTLK